jgi:hypothetical protein
MDGRAAAQKSAHTGPRVAWTAGRRKCIMVASGRLHGTPESHQDAGGLYDGHGAVGARAQDRGRLMSCTVFANDDGLFHKGSGGTTRAFPDVCLSPPPAPTGPIPVPYLNMAKAGDLANGSKSVKIQGQPTALEGKSYVKTSTGDEAGNQGGNVITHKTKGKAYFQFWSLDVLIEGCGVARHKDPVGQNCTSLPIGGLNPEAKTALSQARRKRKKCATAYSKSKRHSIVKEQREEVNRTKRGKPPQCWQCGSTSPCGKRPDGQPYQRCRRKSFTPDHQPPVVILWYRGGCHLTKPKWKKLTQNPKGVKPHCRQCSNLQGVFSTLSRFLKKLHRARRR